MIHRDVKPGNILFGDSRTAKIVDFGLAMFTHQLEESTGEVWGTPYYIPPEKLDGGTEDFRSDIYSLGASLFHALAGRPPFDAANATLVAIKHIKSQAVSLQAFAPWVSNPTAHIINRTLAKNQADRFQSYDDLIHNLEYALDQLRQGGGKAPTRARVVLETEEDRKTWTWVVLGMAAVIVVMLGIFAFTRSKAQSTPVTAKTPAKPVSTPHSSFGLGDEVKALASNDTNAATQLQSAAENSTKIASDRAWAQLLAGAAHLAAGRRDEAREAFQKVEPLVAEVKDPQLGSFMKTVSAQLSMPDHIPQSDTQRFDKTNHESAGYLLHGLHNWQEGALDDGAAALRQFRSCNIEGSAAWLADLKVLSTGFAEQFANFQMAAESLKSANNPNERSIAAKALRKLGPHRQARGIRDSTVREGNQEFRGDVDQDSGAGTLPHLQQTLESPHRRRQPIDQPGRKGAPMGTFWKPQSNMGTRSCRGRHLQAPGRPQRAGAESAKRHFQARCRNVAVDGRWHTGRFMET